jgi:hypothetical protein
MLESAGHRLGADQAGERVRRRRPGRLRFPEPDRPQRHPNPDHDPHQPVGHLPLFRAVPPAPLPRGLIAGRSTTRTRPGCPKGSVVRRRHPSLSDGYPARCQTCRIRTPQHSASASTQSMGFFSSFIKHRRPLAALRHGSALGPVLRLARTGRTDSASRPQPGRPPAMPPARGGCTHWVTPRRPGPGRRRSGAPPRAGRPGARPGGSGYPPDRVGEGGRRGRPGPRPRPLARKPPWR